jgi:hypothetical protein
MSMTLSGDGTITGLVAGGLPDATVVDADLSLTANSAQVMVALNASGSAPIFACRAWVNFNGTGTPAIRASGNVSSITDNGTSDYTVNFTTAMSDANYAVTGIGYHLVNVTEGPLVAYQGSQASGSVRIQYRGNGGNPDPETVQVAIFR